MPTLKASIKDLRKSARRHLRNRAALSRVKSAMRHVRGAKALDSGTKALKTAVQIIDKAVTKGYLHFRTGARYKSRLSSFVSKLK